MAGGLDYNAPLLSVHRSSSSRHKLPTDKTSHSSFDHSSHCPLVVPKQEPVDYVLPLPPGRSPAVVEEEKSSPPHSTLPTTVKLPPLPVLRRGDSNTGHHYGLQNAAVEGEEERVADTWKNARTERPKSFSILQPSTLKISGMQARADYRETRRNSIDETRRLTSNVEVAPLQDSDAGDDATDVGKMGSEDEEEPHQVSRTDPRARDFIMRRFLPAAQAMATDTTEASDRRLSLDSRCQLSQRPLTRFANIGSRHNEEKSLGSVESLRRQRFRDSRLSRTSFRSSIRTSFHTAKCSSRRSLSPVSSSWRKGYEDDDSVQSEEFWSDEGPSEGRPYRRSYQWPPYVSSDTEGMSPRSARRQDAILMTEMIKLKDSDNYYNIKTNRRMSLPADTKGFLGLPENSDYRDSQDRASEWGETHRVNRIGARLVNVLGGTNNTTPVVPNVRNRAPQQHYHIEWTQEGDSDEESESKDWQMVIQGQTTTSIAVDPVKDLQKKEDLPPKRYMFPPLPKSPSESWLCSSAAVPASKNQTKIPRAISLKSLPAAAEVQGNTWESKALQYIEVSHNQSGRFGAPHILRS